MTQVILSGTAADGALLTLGVDYTPGPANLFDPTDAVAFGTATKTGTTLAINETSGSGGGARSAHFPADPGDKFLVYVPITSISGDTFGCAVSINGSLPRPYPWWTTTGDHAEVVTAGTGTGTSGGLVIALQGDEITASIDLSLVRVVRLPA